MLRDDLFVHSVQFSGIGCNVTHKKNEVLMPAVIWVELENILWKMPDILDHLL